MNAFTVMSGKGQVVIPKSTRDRLRLAPGDRLEVVERADGVLLRCCPTLPRETYEALTARIRSRIAYDGPPVSVEDMDAAVAAAWDAGGPDWDR